MGAHSGNRPYGNASYDDTFYVLVDTNGRSDGLTTVELNINESTGGDRYIDWGDGTVEIVNTELPSHTYAEHGEYEIFAWGGTTTRLGQRGGSTNVGWTETIKTVRCGSEFGFTSMSYAFHVVTGAELNVSNLNTSNVTDMSSMFFFCDLVSDLDVSNFDTSSVTNMDQMFRDCNSLTALDVTNFDTSSVTDMYKMFQSCFSLTTLDVSNFDTSSVTGMGFMFSECASLTPLDVTNFDTSSVTSMNTMFFSCLSLTNLDVSNFDTSSVDNMYDMFRNCSSLTSLDVSNFDTSSVKFMTGMFSGCSSLTDIVGVEDFNIEFLDEFFSLFGFATNVTLPTARYDALLINWDAQDPLDGMLADFGNSQYAAGSAARESLIQNDGWTITDGGPSPFELTVETTTANETFLLPMRSVTSIDIDWGDGNVETGITSDDPTHVYATAGTHAISVTGTAGTVVFRGSGSETKLRTVTNLGALGWTTFFLSFRDCSSMTSFDAGDCGTSNVTDMGAMFENCSSLTSLDVTNFDTSSVTRMSDMFENCSSLTSLDVSNFDTSSVTLMSAMFSSCSSLTTLDLSNFNTSSVTSMGAMFAGCSAFTALDVTNFDTSSVTGMAEMFLGCSSLTTLDVSNFDTSSVTLMTAMFYNCSSLTDIVGVEGFNIEGFDDSSSFPLAAFAQNVTLPTSRYDALLVNWDAQDPLDGLFPNFGNSTYTAGGAAEAARTSLISGDGWTITDGGAAP